MHRNEHGDVIDKRFEFINGRKLMYKGIERGLVGFTVILKRPDSSTWINLQSEDEAWDTINNHCENYDKYVEIDKLKGEYLSSKEGNWGL